MLKERKAKTNILNKVSKRKEINKKDAKLFALEEYKALRAEMLVHQDDNTKILQFGLTAIGALLGFPLIGQIQKGAYIWLYLFVPSLVIFPIVALMAQRVRQSWKISRYIREQLEANYGLGWETYNIETRNAPKRISPKYIVSSSLVFLIIQIVIPGLSLLSLYDQVKNKCFPQISYLFWAILTLVVLGLFIYEILIIREASNPNLS